MKHIVTKGIAASLLTAPTAHITTNKSRRKIHTGNQVYLKDGENFEFELFNPTTGSVLAKIKLNGKEISSSGIVLKPGQRVFLDRFFDSPHKFKFDTYEVNGNNLDVQKAIDLNGSVEVNFYSEYIPLPQYNNFPYTYTYTNSIPTYYWNQVYGGCSTNPAITTTGGVYNTAIGGATSSTLTTSAYNSATIAANSLTFGNTVLANNTANLQSQANSQNNDLRSTLSKKTVTGTVEKGEKSNQEFEYVNKNFNSYTLNTVKYKILPFENKPIEVAEIKKSNFCTSCGYKLPTNANFCGDCGKKV